MSNDDKTPKKTQEEQEASLQEIEKAAREMVEKMNEQKRVAVAYLETGNFQSAIMEARYWKNLLK